MEDSPPRHGPSTTPCSSSGGRRRDFHFVNAPAIRARWWGAAQLSRLCAGGLCRNLRSACLPYQQGLHHRWCGDRPGGQRRLDRTAPPPHRRVGDGHGGDPQLGRGSGGFVNGNPHVHPSGAHASIHRGRRLPRAAPARDSGGTQGRAVINRTGAG